MARAARGSDGHVGLTLRGYRALEVGELNITSDLYERICDLVRLADGIEPVTMQALRRGARGLCWPPRPMEVSVRKRLTAIALSGALILTLSGSFASLGSVPSAAVSSYRNRDSASPAVLPGRRSEIEEGCQPPAGDRPLPTTCGPEGLFGQRPP